MTRRTGSANSNDVKSDWRSCMAFTQWALVKVHDALVVITSKVG